MKCILFKLVIVIAFAQVDVVSQDYPTSNNTFKVNQCPITCLNVFLFLQNLNAKKRQISSFRKLRVLLEEIIDYRSVISFMIAGKLFSLEINTPYHVTRFFTSHPYSEIIHSILIKTLQRNLTIWFLPKFFILIAPKNIIRL